MKKLEPYENQMMYLVGGSMLPSTPGERELEHKQRRNEGKVDMAILVI